MLSQIHQFSLRAREIRKETTPCLKLDDRNDDSMRPCAASFAVKCRKLRIYSLHKHHKVFWKLASTDGSIECARAWFVHFGWFNEEDLSRWIDNSWQTHINPHWQLTFRITKVSYREYKSWINPELPFCSRFILSSIPPPTSPRGGFPYIAMTQS